MSWASCVFFLVYSLKACTIAYLIVLKCSEIWNFRQHYFRFRSVNFFHCWHFVFAPSAMPWKRFLKNSVNWKNWKVKNEFQNAGVFTKNFWQNIIFIRLYAKFKHNLPRNFRENETFVCLLAFLHKLFCVAMATFMALLLQPIDEALLSLFQGKIWWLSAEPT